MERYISILVLFFVVYGSAKDTLVATEKNENGTSMTTEECAQENANGSCNFEVQVDPDGSIHQEGLKVDDFNENGEAARDSSSSSSQSINPKAPMIHKNDKLPPVEEEEEIKESEFGGDNVEYESQEYYTFEFDVLPPELKFKDLHEKCALWASEGACDGDPLFMLKECVPSCLLNPQVQEFGLLDWTFVPEIYLDKNCDDRHETRKEKRLEENESGGERYEDDDEDEEGCYEWMSVGLCCSFEDKDFMLQMCRRTCRVCHNPEDDEYDLGEPQRVPQEILNETLNVLIEMAEYIHERFLNPNIKLYDSTRSTCANKDSHCAIYAAGGACVPGHENYEWMAMNCAPICQTCELQDFSIRCPIPENAVDALATNGGENGLHAIFERIVGERDLTQTQVDGGMNEIHYKVNIFSRPLDEAKKAKSEDDQDGEDDGIIDGPWVITLEDFVTQEECDEMIKAGMEIGYHVSVETITQRDGTQGEDFESETRTSTNAWCDDECKENSIIKRVQQRIATVTGFPVENSEDLQLLHYERGQFYKVHHDLVTAHVNGPSGPRVLTFFLYLNDLDEDAGGGTSFPQLAPGASPVTIQPKRGTALVWPSVLDENINEGDYRTEHEALPVKSGVKYGANAWLHLRSEQIEGIECG